MNPLTIPQKQRGATLLISLVLLLVLTILALAAARSAGLQQRMASNLQQQDMAFQIAENGIQAAILKLNDDEYERPEYNTSKYLISDIKAGASLPDWSNTPCSIPNQGYCVEVKQVDCGGGSLTAGSAGGAASSGVNNSINLSGGTCYRITSSAQFESAKAVHQQGYMF